MSRREDIDNAIWSDPDFLALTPEARLTYIWSWTNPRCGMAGLYKVALSQAALEIGHPTETLERALAELAEHRFAFYQDSVLFVRARVKRMRQKTEQIAKSIRSDVEQITDNHPLKRSWIAENGHALWLLRHLGPDTQWTLDRPSLEGVGVGPLGPDVGGSTEGHQTLKGKGNGKGTGKGPLGRGVGRGRDSWLRWAEEHMPDYPADFVAQVGPLVVERGITPTAESIAKELALRFPASFPGGLAA